MQPLIHRGSGLSQLDYSKNGIGLIRNGRERGKDGWSASRQKGQKSTVDFAVRKMLIRT